MFIKIDLSKAYDRLEWPFLELVLHEWGFSDQVRRLIMSCVSTVRYNLLLNGSLCKDFTSTRGVRQGDLLSPYLFILCAEILSRLLVKEEAINNIQGIKVSREAPAISHLLYADDIIIACRANESNAKVVQRTLELFGKWFGQQINKEKSQIFSLKIQREGLKLLLRKSSDLKSLELQLFI